MIGISMRLVCLSAIIGKIKTVIPRTNAILAILEPTTFPTAIPGFPSSALVKLTSNSGADVPNETIVIPTISGEIFMAVEKPTAPFTRNSPPKIKTTKPSKRNT